jgi:hypothetical protein
MDKCFCHLNGYAVKDATARSEISNIKENYATKEYVTENREDLSNYATKEYVNEAMENIDESKIDLSNYYTKEEIDNSKPVILFEHEGTLGDVVLSDSAANYSYLEIYYRNNRSEDFGCERIYNPDGKQVIIDTMSCAMASNDLNLHIMLKRVEISGVNITVKDYGYVHTSAKAITSASKTDYVYITRVEGYK